MFRGREQAHPERGRDLLNRLHVDLDGLADIESKPLQEGRNMSMLLGPSKEALKEVARKDSKKDDSEARPEVPDHPQAVVPDHPQAIATTPEDLAEAAESAKQDVAPAED
jgi:translation initiation factor IF-3